MWVEILKQNGNAVKRWPIPFFIHPFIFFTVNQLCWQCFSACTRFYENKARLVNLLLSKTLKLKASYSSLKVLREQKMYAGTAGWAGVKGVLSRHFQMSPLPWRREEFVELGNASGWWNSEAAELWSRGDASGQLPVGFPFICQAVLRLSTQWDIFVQFKRVF